MAIALVQSKTASTLAATATSLNLVFDSAPTNGNILIVTVASNQTAYISSTADIIWTATIDSGATATFLTILTGRVITASASATVTISIIISGTIAAAGAEFSGFTRARIDKTVAATASTNAPNTGNTGTTSTSAQLWISGISTRFTSGVTYSNAFIGGVAATNLYQNSTNVATTADKSVAFMYRIVATTGVANANATMSNSGVWMDRIITIEDTPASGGGLRAAGHGGLAA